VSTPTGFCIVDSYLKVKNNKKIKHCCVSVATMVSRKHRKSCSTYIAYLVMYLLYNTSVINPYLVTDDDKDDDDDDNDNMAKKSPFSLAL
jgi:hypothetical protein